MMMSRGRDRLVRGRGGIQYSRVALAIEEDQRIRLQLEIASDLRRWIKDVSSINLVSKGDRRLGASQKKLRRGLGIREAGFEAHPALQRLSDLLRTPDPMISSRTTTRARLSRNKLPYWKHMLAMGNLVSCNVLGRTHGCPRR